MNERTNNNNNQKMVFPLFDFQLWIRVKWRWQRGRPSNNTFREKKLELFSGWRTHASVKFGIQTKLIDEFCARVGRDLDWRRYRVLANNNENRCVVCVYIYYMIECDCVCCVGDGVCYGWCLCVSLNVTMIRFGGLTVILRRAGIIVWGLFEELFRQYLYQR